MTGDRPPRGAVDSHDNDKRRHKADTSRQQALRPRHPPCDPFNCTRRRNEEKQNRKEHGFGSSNGNPHDDNISPQLPSEPRRPHQRQRKSHQENRCIRNPPRSPSRDQSAHVPIEDSPSLQQNYNGRNLCKSTLVKGRPRNDSAKVILQETPSKAVVAEGNPRPKESCELPARQSANHPRAATEHPPRQTPVRLRLPLFHIAKALILPRRRQSRLTCRSARGRSTCRRVRAECRLARASGGRA